MNTLLQKIGAIFFRLRDVLPVPMVLGLVFFSRPRKLGWFLGAPFIFTGELIRVWALMHIGPTTRTRKICADKLVTSGPYALTRNPLYLANFFKVFGLLIVGGNLTFSLWVIGFYWLEFFTMIRYEELFLARTFPETFKKYCLEVPAFFPNGRSFNQRKELSLMSSLAACGASRPELEGSYSLKQALWSERCTFGSTCAILAILALAEMRTKQV